MDRASKPPHFSNSTFSLAAIHFTWLLAIEALGHAIYSLPVHAGPRLVSPNGFATITTGDKCFTNRPTGRYQFKDGTKGNLTAIDCSRIGGDAFTHRFQDTSGSSRCQGIVTTIYGARPTGITTIWEVQSPVPGFPCSQAGRTFELDMTFAEPYLN
jgi:hypothetical protein